MECYYTWWIFLYLNNSFFWSVCVQWPIWILSVDAWFCSSSVCSCIFWIILRWFPIAPYVAFVFPFYVHSISIVFCLYVRIFSASCLYYYYHHHHHRMFHFSASAGKHSPILGCVINRIRLSGLIYNLKSSLQLNMFQELQIFAFVCMYSDTG
jgi:hypothetical protein